MTAVFRTTFVRPVVQRRYEEVDGAMNRDEDVDACRRDTEHLRFAVTVIAVTMGSATCDGDHRSLRDSYFDVLYRNQKKVPVSPGMPA
jgi:hypothetical protein